MKITINATGIAINGTIKHHNKSLLLVFSFSIRFTMAINTNAIIDSNIQDKIIIIVNIVIITFSYNVIQYDS